IVDMPLGRIDEVTSANVGLVRGGTARNVVPERCTLEAEVRSHDDARVGEVVQQIVDAAAFAASVSECSLETRVEPKYRGYRFREDDLAVRLAVEALAQTGYTARLGLSGGAADANVFNARGLQCVNLANGMTDIHTPDELVRLEVDGAPCIAYPRLTGEVEVGDVVLVNGRAVELGLGSGGFDVLYANLTRGLQLPVETGAHVMTLPYAPGQVATRFAEEDADAETERERLDGLPVVCLGLHSQLAPVCAALAGRRVAYVQLGGGALPVSLSDTVRILKARRLLDTTIAVSPCLDGDVQCVTAAAALVHAVGRGAEVVVC